MKQVKLKICGVTLKEQALAISKLDVDAIGFVLYPPSPRFIPLEEIAAVIDDLPPFLTTVGVFVNEPLDALIRKMSVSGLDIAQISGDESPRYCQELTDKGIRWIRSFRIKNSDDVQTVDQYPGRFHIFDAWDSREYGGTGKVFDWRVLARLRQQYQIILAGGLNATNITEAIKAVRPYALDISSGVEDSPGVKNIELIEKLIGRITDFERPAF